MVMMESLIIEYTLYSKHCPKNSRCLWVSPNRLLLLLHFTDKQTDVKVIH